MNQVLKATRSHVFRSKVPQPKLPTAGDVFLSDPNARVFWLGPFSQISWPDEGKEGILAI